jgi:hypothetical protein
LQIGQGSPGAAHAAEVFIPSAVRMVLAHPTDAQADAAIFVRQGDAPIPRIPAADARHLQDAADRDATPDDAIIVLAFLADDDGDAQDELIGGRDHLVFLKRDSDAISKGFVCFISNYSETHHMAKKHVLAHELNWIVQEELMANVSPGRWVPIAVVPDKKQGWRILRPKLDGRTAWTSKVAVRIPAVERRLREKYALKE